MCEPTGRLCWTGLCVSVSVWHAAFLPTFSQLSSLHKAHSLRRKKRRNMLAIFGFRKNRSQTLSNQGPESEVEVYGDGCHTVATAPTGWDIFHRHTLRLFLGKTLSSRNGIPLCPLVIHHSSKALLIKQLLKATSCNRFCLKVSATRAFKCLKKINK